MIEKKKEETPICGNHLVSCFFLPVKSLVCTELSELTTLYSPGPSFSIQPQPQVFAKCELARDDDMGGGANTDYNNGGSDNDSVQNDMSTGGDDFDVDSLKGTKKWQDACDYALTDTQCTDVEHEGKNAEEGDKGCTWTEGASSGYCGPEGDDTDAETQQKCFAVSDDFETNDAQKKSQCNLMSTDDESGCAWAATEAQGSCQRYDLCEK